MVGYDGGWNVRDEEQQVGRQEPDSKQGEETKQSRWGFRGMTVRDWLQLLIVPLALVVIGFLFTAQQDQRQQNIENQRAEAERELAVRRAQDEALQAYLDQMGSLLLARDLRTSKEDSEVRTLARARTLTVLGRLDPSRKTTVMKFLAEAKLIQKVEGRGAIITFSGADLSGANLTDADDDLSGADLRFADLSGANLSCFRSEGSRTILTFDAGQRCSDLSGANLIGADLSGANLSCASNVRVMLSGQRCSDLSGANLSDADLSGAHLSLADLSDAYLSDANLTDADLNGAHLSDANLHSARGITNEELEQQAAFLEDATMPNGQKYEDWLKDREKRQQDE